MKASINNIERCGIVLVTLLLFINFLGFTSVVSAQTSTETDFMSILNTQRISLDKIPLSINSSLSTAAYLHSKDMAENNYFSHTSLDGTTFVQRIVAAGYTNWTSLAENIAYYYGSPDATIIYNMWLNSPGHYANMIGDFAEAGLGVYTLNNYTYCTLDLGKNSYPIPSTIGFSPSSFTFTATQGGTNPLNQTLNVQNTGTSTLNWSVSDNATWLTLSPASGSSTGEIDIVTASVNISGMTSGSYGATITIAATGASNTPRTVPVNLIIHSSPTTADVTISLEAGWNMVSVPWYITGTGTAPDIFFAGLGTNLNSVYAFDACAQAASQWSAWNKVTGGALTIDDGKGYWVNVTSPATIVLTGTLNPTNPSDPLPSYNVCSGWNLIGFKNGYNTAAISDYLAPPLNFSSIYTFDNGIWKIPASLEPGLAYWVYFTVPGIIYP